MTDNICFHATPEGAPLEEATHEVVATPKGAIPEGRDYQAFNTFVMLRTLCLSGNCSFISQNLTTTHVSRITPDIGLFIIEAWRVNTNPKRFKPLHGPTE